MSTYTIYSIDSNSGTSESNRLLIEQNTQAVFDYIDRYVDRQGSLEAAIIILPNSAYADLGLDIDGLISVGTEIISEGSGWSNAILTESITGVDPTPNNSEIAIYIVLDKQGGISIDGIPVWLDPNPNPYGFAAVPDGYIDLYSVLLTNIFAGLGLDARTNEWQEKLVQSNSRYYFDGSKVKELFGGLLPLESGSIYNLPDRYGNESTPLESMDQGLMGLNANYVGNRLQIGQIDLAILEDLGYTIKNYDELSLFAPELKTLEWIYGSSHADFFYGDASSNLLDSGAGIDYFLLQGTLDEYDVRRDALGTILSADQVLGRDGVDIFANVERLAFTDTMLALDTAANENAGNSYLLYQAAFDRTPDVEGLGYWISKVDGGANIVRDVAQNFILSSEFKSLYGANPSVPEFMGLLYQNVLNRTPDAEGLKYWLDEFAQAGDSTLYRAGLLNNFAISAENIANVADQIAGGIQYQAYVG